MKVAKRLVKYEWEGQNALDVLIPKINRLHWCCGWEDKTDEADYEDVSFGAHIHTVRPQLRAISHPGYVISEPGTRRLNYVRGHSRAPHLSTPYEHPVFIFNIHWTLYAINLLPQNLKKPMLNNLQTLQTPRKSHRV